MLDGREQILRYTQDDRVRSILAGLVALSRAKPRTGASHGNLDPAPRESRGRRAVDSRRGEGADPWRARDDAFGRAGDRPSRAEARRDPDEPSRQSPSDRRAGRPGPRSEGRIYRDRRARSGRPPQRDPEG